MESKGSSTHPYGTPKITFLYSMDLPLTTHSAVYLIEIQLVYLVKSHQHLTV